EPIQYIIGHVEFGALKLKVDKRALIPRPETEYLLELLGRHLPGDPVSILDLGTGSGALVLALAKRFPQAAVTAVDNSEAALSLARENEALNDMPGRVQWFLSDWFTAVPRGEQFQLIVANPPYLSDEETAA